MTTPAASSSGNAQQLDSCGGATRGSAASDLRKLEHATVANHAVGAIRLASGAHSRADLADDRAGAALVLSALAVALPPCALRIGLLPKIYQPPRDLLGACVVTAAPTPLLPLESCESSTLNPSTQNHNLTSSPLNLAANKAQAGR